MKRFAVITLAMLTLVMFCFPVTNTGAQEKKIAVMWVGNYNPDTGRILPSVMPKRVAMAMIPRLKEIAPQISVVNRMDLKTMQEAEKLFNEFQETMDGVVFLRSSGTEYLAKVKPKVPTFVGATNNPKLLGAIQNLEAPEGNITGVTYFIPYYRYFDLIQKLFPQVKRVALLVRKGHPGGTLDREGTQEQCHMRGIEYHEVHVNNVDELIAGTREILDKVDLLIISNTDVALDNAVTIWGLSNQRERKVPIFSYGEKPVTNGAVAGMAARDDYLGQALADSVADVIVKGKPIREVPVKTDPQPKITINEGIMKTLGLDFPQDILRAATILR